MCGEGAGTDGTCQKWFARFRAGDLSLDGAPRSGRPVEVDNNQTETFTERHMSVIFTILVSAAIYEFEAVS